MEFLELLIFVVIVIAILYVLGLALPYLIIGGVVLYVIGWIINIFRKNDRQDTYQDSYYSQDPGSSDPNVIDVEYTEREDNDQ